MERRNGTLGYRCECEAKELTRDVEHRVAKLAELEVLLDLVGIKVIARPPYFFGVVAVVPWLDRDAITAAGLGFGVGDRLHGGDLLLDPRERGGPHCLEEIHRPLGRLGHAVFEAPLGIVVVALELHALVAQLEDLRDDRVVVVVVAVVTAAVVRAPHLLAQIALGGKGQEWIHRRAGVGDGVLVGLVAGCGGSSGRRDERIREASELVLVQKEDVGLFVTEHVFRKTGMKLGECVLNLGVACLGLAFEGGAVAREPPVNQLDDALLVGTKSAAIVGLGGLMDGCNATEQCLVLHDRGAMCGQLGRHLCLHGAKLGRRAVGAPDAEVGAHPRHRIAGPFHGHDRVLEGGGVGIGRDGLDLSQVFGHGGIKGRLEVGQLHAIECWDAAVVAAPGCE